MHVVILSHLLAGAAGAALVLKAHGLVEAAGGFVARVVVQIDPVKGVFFEGSVENPLERLTAKAFAAQGGIADIDAVDLQGIQLAADSVQVDPA